MIHLIVVMVAIVVCIACIISIILLNNQIQTIQDDVTDIHRITDHFTVYDNTDGVNTLSLSSHINVPSLSTQPDGFIMFSRHTWEKSQEKINEVDISNLVDLTHVSSDGVSIVTGHTNTSLLSGVTSAIEDIVSDDSRTNLTTMELVEDIYRSAIHRWDVNGTLHLWTGGAWLADLPVE